MVYFKKDGGSCFEEILIREMERSERMRKRKQAVKLIAIISAVCAAVAGTVLIIRHNAKKPKV